MGKTRPLEVKNWMKSIGKMQMSTKAMITHNHFCIKCDIVEKMMISVGRFATITFCEKCYKEEFQTDDPMRLEKETFQKWADINKKKIEKELDN